MAEADFHLSGNLTGKVESQSFTKEGAGEIDIAYSHDRCTSAWLVYTTSDDENEIPRNIPIIPSQSGKSPHASLPDKAKFKIIACMSAKGHFRARVYY